MSESIAERGNRIVNQGIVKKQSGDKTVSVEIKTKVKHPIYKKYVPHVYKCLVHDEKNESAVGDVVKIVESRPFSKTKKWRLLEIVEKAS